MAKRIRPSRIATKSATPPSIPPVRGDGLPTLKSMPEASSAMVSIDGYAQQLVADAGPTVSFDKSYGSAFIKGMMNEIQKAITAPPSMMSYARISYMPEMHNAGVMQWPGIPPEALAKVVKENLAPQLIIGMRVDDVQRYSQLSNQAWKPGWKIVPRTQGTQISKETMRDIRDAERFVANCNIETRWDQARERDAQGYTGIQRFLAMLVRDSLTYDGMAIWTDMDAKGRVKAFQALPAGRIRMTGPNGYAKPGAPPDKSIYAVAVDDTGSVMHTFTRNDLIWYVRNPRADADIFGYGYPEIELGMRLIQGATNILDMGIDRFNTSAIPQGMLLLTGNGWNQRQLDVMARMWTNLKNGTTKSWALPAIQVPREGKIEVLDLSDLAGKEVYYQDFANMIYGMFCTLFRFPVTRLGYRISGKGPDTHPDSGSASQGIIDEDDPGLAPLLNHIEAVYNEYLIWSRWPDLQFTFTGKSPKEDAREYEARSLAMTVDERRVQAGLLPLKDVIDKKYEMMATLLGMAPTDPALTGAFQSMAATLLGQGSGQEDKKKIGAPFGHKIDPAAGEEHGHTSGVRRENDVK